jgi:hypothetical protein
MQSYAAILEGRNAKPSKFDSGSLAQGSMCEPMSLPDSLAAAPPLNETENLWPSESLENEQRFGYYHARLFPFVERRVWTPAGTGKLYRTSADYSEIILDGSRRNPDGSENRIRVRTKDVRPIQ